MVVVGGTYRNRTAIGQRVAVVLKSAAAMVRYSRCIEPTANLHTSRKLRTISPSPNWRSECRCLLRKRPKCIGWLRLDQRVASHDLHFSWNKIFSTWRYRRRTGGELWRPALPYGKTNNNTSANTSLNPGRNALIVYAGLTKSLHFANGSKRRNDLNGF